MVLPAPPRSPLWGSQLLGVYLSKARRPSSVFSRNPCQRINHTYQNRDLLML